MEKSKFLYEEDEEPIVLSKYIFDLFLKQKKPADLIALYSFYYYTAKWQKTTITKATTNYVAKALHWSEIKVRKLKRVLIEFNLLENVIKRNTDSKITGHFVRVKFLWSKYNQLIQNEIPIPTKTDPLVINTPNALITNNKRIHDDDTKISDRGKLLLPFFEDFWKLYPRKAYKGKALDAWNKRCKKGDCPTWREIRRALIAQKRTEQWQNTKLIPLPTTWINQSRWLDDPDEMIRFDAVQKSKFEPGFEEIGKSNYYNNKDD